MSFAESTASCPVPAAGGVTCHAILEHGAAIIRRGPTTSRRNDTGERPVPLATRRRPRAGSRVAHYMRRRACGRPCLVTVGSPREATEAVIGTSRLRSAAVEHAVGSKGLPIAEWAADMCCIH